MLHLNNECLIPKRGRSWSKHNTAAAAAAEKEEFVVGTLSSSCFFYYLINCCTFRILMPFEADTTQRSTHAHLMASRSKYESSEASACLYLLRSTAFEFRAWMLRATTWNHWDVGQRWRHCDPRKRRKTLGWIIKRISFSF